jgi:transcriptional regulator with XRE-family HTH domain
MELVDFGELHQRLVAALRARVRNGELSERRLAHLTGISQPHVHNVLKGARTLSPRMADRILRRLDLNLLDLIGQERPYVEVPVLDGWLGPGFPLPIIPSRVESYPFPKSYIASLHDAAAARLAADPKMAELFRENDLVLLDRSLKDRIGFGEGVFYVVNYQGEGRVRRVRREGACLLLLAGGGEAAEAVGLSGVHLPDLIVARVRWIGRLLEPAPSPGGEGFSI